MPLQVILPPFRLQPDDAVEDAYYKGIAWSHEGHH